LGGGERFKRGADGSGETEEKEGGEKLHAGRVPGAEVKKAITKIYDAGRQ
jgi:hypothetical protein